MVWGSAGSRNVPGGFERDKAWQQIQSFLHVAGDIAQQNNLIIAIEPLRKQESNIINTAEQALQLVRDLDSMRLYEQAIESSAARAGINYDCMLGRSRRRIIASGHRENRLLTDLRNGALPTRVSNVVCCGGKDSS